MDENEECDGHSAAVAGRNLSDTIGSSGSARLNQRKSQDEPNLKQVLNIPQDLGWVALQPSSSAQTQESSPPSSAVMFKDRAAPYNWTNR